MAKAKKPANREAPPEPGDRKAFESWLVRQPHEWSIAISVRAALRVLPLLVEDNNRFPAIVLPMLRATAIARFAARYPNRAIEARSAAAAAGNAATIAATDAASSAALATNAAGASAANAARAAADVATVTATTADAAAFTAFAAASAVVFAGHAHAVIAAVSDDANRLHDKSITAQLLVGTRLWSQSAPPELAAAWIQFKRRLHPLGRHWQVWIDWYENGVLQQPFHAISEGEDAAFTDLPGVLPWDQGAEAVNTEIARRLAEIVKPKIAEESASLSKAEQLEQLTEVASPQPSLTSEGVLDAGPNKPFDSPRASEDLAILPLRQMNLIKIILSDLPRNAPAHLRVSIESYDQELKVRGFRPILLLLKDDADIIVAAIHASRADDEWLEPGQRKAFERFVANHLTFMRYFPLDVEREKIYTQTRIDDGQIAGEELVKPFDKVAEATQDVHREGGVTDNFATAVEKLTELVRILPSQPVATKKRFLLRALGFFSGTATLIASLGKLATVDYSILLSRLEEIVQILLRLIQ